MKPFSKNLFSQTPVAFGWLPKETINLDISMCVSLCVCVRLGMCLCVCCSHMSGRFFVALFYRTQTQVWAKADQLQSVCTSANMQQHRAPYKTVLPKNGAAKTQHPLITCPSFLSSFYTFTPTRSPNATPKHPSMSTPQTPPFHPSSDLYQRKV